MFVTSRQLGLLRGGSAAAVLLLLSNAVAFAADEQPGAAMPAPDAPGSTIVPGGTPEVGQKNPATTATEPAKPDAPKSDKPGVAANATPDWPCVQRKVADLTAAQMWDGPPTDGIKNWYEDQDVTVLARKLASRRVSIEEAGQAIKAYAEKLPKAERDQKLTAVFVGALSVTNDDRRAIINGIEKFQRGQVARSKKLEEESKKFGPAQLGEHAILETLTTGKMSPEQEQYNWDARVFQERQNQIPLACEIPVLIEERFFQVVRAIRENMTDAAPASEAAAKPAAETKPAEAAPAPPATDKK